MRSVLMTDDEYNIEEDRTVERLSICRKRFWRLWRTLNPVINIDAKCRVISSCHVYS